MSRNFVPGLLVSLIALPLCVAISIASGFPVLSGIFTAIIGGILVSQISGSHVTINGPAAGMIVVILDAVEKLGQGNILLGYKYTLAAIVCAALFQVATSFSKLPEFLRKFPESIIRGMMMSIGLIVIIKQTFVLCGIKAPKVGLIELAAHIPNAFRGMQIETFSIGFGAILFIFFWKKFFEKFSVFRFVPVYLIAITLGSIMASYVNTAFINIPSDLGGALSLPDFTRFFSADFFFATFSIFAVGSLETVLSAIAVDKIDPKNRRADLKKDLRGVGVGNLICGFVGALPMIAEIVRSTANVKYGATNKWANFFHGICLLVMITIFRDFLKFIPTCLLAGMLIIIGFGMVNLKLFLQVFKRDKVDFVVIISVIFFTLKVDLLAGILSGIVAHLILQKIFPSHTSHGLDQH
ncbi:MAG: SulP family inorganic anion transporter [Proteobacteria bacterium]|nr:SulP family inorganic anion transporter [Pseudomonadota bacterium]